MASGRDAKRRLENLKNNADNWTWEQMGWPGGGRTSDGWLDLSFCDLRDDGCKKVGDLLRSDEGKKIKKLSLNKNKIADVGAKHLADVLLANDTSETLELDLVGNEITHVGAQHFANALRSNITLKRLDLGKNRGIRNVGVRYFADALRSNKTLEKLVLNETCQDYEVQREVEELSENPGGRYEETAKEDAAQKNAESNPTATATPPAVSVPEVVTAPTLAYTAPVVVSAEMPAAVPAEGAQEDPGNDDVLVYNLDGTVSTIHAHEEEKREKTKTGCKCTIC